MFSMFSFVSAVSGLHFYTNKLYMIIIIRCCFLHEMRQTKLIGSTFLKADMHIICYIGKMTKCKIILSWVLKCLFIFSEMFLQFWQNGRLKQEEAAVKVLITLQINITGPSSNCKSYRLGNCSCVIFNSVLQESPRKVIFWLFPSMQSVSGWQHNALAVLQSAAGAPKYKPIIQGRRLLLQI